jgi:RND family efflux transporter MFP subunit
MTQTHDQPAGAAPAPPKRPGRALGSAIAIVLAVASLGGGGALAAYWFLNRPQARRRPPRSGAVLVELTEVRSSRHRVVVEAMGTVIPAREISLGARVSGQVHAVESQFVPGGLFAEGQVMLRIDPEDFQITETKWLLAVQRRRLETQQRDNDIALRTAELAKAKEALKLEEGMQVVALRGYQRVGQTDDARDEDLILRRPQLASAKKAVEAAEAAVKSARAAKASADQAVEEARNSLREARLALARTEVTAPFSGTVVQRNVELGSQVAAGQALATFVGTDEYWVLTSVPVDELRWIDLPADGRGGSSARIYHESHWGPDKWRAGEVVRVLPGLEPQGRMARVIVKVADPLGLASEQAREAPLLLDAYVRAQIDGRQLDEVVRIPRSALHEGEYVWVASPDKKLDVRRVDVVRKGKAYVYVSGGLKPGERMVTSDLAAPVAGLPLRTAEDGPPGRRSRGDRPASKPATGPTSDPAGQDGKEARK